MTQPPKITTSLWFADDTEAAIRFYLSVFKDGKVLRETRWGEGGPGPKGSLMAARFRIAGQEFVAIHGARVRFNESASLVVACESQQEIDDYWAKLGAGGKPGRCGWLEDKYGLSWQIVPRGLDEWLGDPDPRKAARVGQALMQMGKLDIGKLLAARAGG